MVKYKNAAMQHAYRLARDADLTQLSPDHRDRLARFAIKQILTDRTVIERDPETRCRMIDGIYYELPRYIEHLPF